MEHIIGGKDYGVEKCKGDKLKEIWAYERHGKCILERPGLLLAFLTVALHCGGGSSARQRRREQRQ